MLNVDNEVWVDVKGYENIYKVSNKGKVKTNKGLIKKTFINNSGYECIDLHKNRKRKKHLIHRLVIEAFKPNPDKNKYTEVNHIDENKLNNNLDNLEWVTPSENRQHSIKSGRYAKIFTQKNSLGKKHKRNTTSKYHNVFYDKERNKWCGVIRHNGKNYGFKRFDTEIEAAKHVNKIIDIYGFYDRPKNIIN